MSYSFFKQVIRNVKRKRGNDIKEHVSGVAQHPNFHSFLEKEIYLTKLPSDRLSDDEEGKLDQAVGGAERTDGSEESLVSSSGAPRSQSTYV